MKSYIKYVVILVIAVVLGGAFCFVKGNKSQTKTKTTIQSPSPFIATQPITSTPSATLKASSTTSIPVKAVSKSKYSIALYGDSLIDTMSDHVGVLNAYLSEMYPTVNFTIYNYGIGAQNIEAGLQRFDASFSNRNRIYPPITEVKPDVIIVGSFAYNPFSPHDKDKHKAMLSELITKMKTTGADVYMLKEIAPLGAGFGDGSVNWEDSQSIEHSNHIIELLENVSIVAAEQNVKVIDVFSLSKAPGSPYGKQSLVSSSDGIHPSEAGHDLTFRTILNRLVLQ